VTLWDPYGSTETTFKLLQFELTTLTRFKRAVLCKIAASKLFCNTVGLF
jgi:hypothetical protein